MKNLLSRFGSFVVCRWVLIALVLLVSFFSIFPPFGESLAIHSDGVGYHLWTRAFLTMDFRFCELQSLYGGEMKERVYYRDPRRDVCLNKYPPGVALVRFPLMASFIDLKSPARSIKTERRISIFSSALAFVLICLFCSQVLASLGVPARLSDQMLAFGVLGTGLFHYSTAEGSYSHVYSALMFAILLRLYLVRPSRALTIGGAVGSFFSALLLVLIRNTNGIALIWVGLAILEFRGSFGGARSALKKVLALALGTLAGAAAQFSYNHYVSGHFTVSSYMNEFFFWHQPHQAEVMFSYERGLFVYYPVMGVALLAAWMEPHSRRAALLFSALIASFVLLYGYWNTWALGNGFGHRGFVEFSPLMIVLLGVALSRLPAPTRAVCLVLGAVCAAVTLSLMFNQWHGQLPDHGATRADYWGALLGRGAPITSATLLVFAIVIVDVILPRRWRKSMCPQAGPA